MKIGILTFHKSINNGAVLQCYSLTKRLQQEFPDDTVEVIDYHMPKIERFYTPSLKNYLLKIVRNLSIDRYRQNRAARKHIDFEIALHELSECLPAPEEAESSLIPLLESFLRSEEELNRKLFMGRYWHAVSVNDLAKHYGVTANAVTKRLIRTREKLRVYLTERGYKI